jgi:hypothetical protein
MEENQDYAAGLSIWDQIRLLQEWSPLLGYGQRFVQTEDVHARSIVVGEAAEWLASKTRSQLDDQLVQLLVAVLRTKEGEALVRWSLLKAEEAK